jgi:hypothetical protein
MATKVKLFHFCVVVALLFNTCDLFPKEDKVSPEDYAYYKAVRFGTPEEMEAFLKAGHDPNYMEGLNSIEWFETCPLWNLLGLYGDTYEKTEILIRYRANTANRGYLARILATGFILSEDLKEEMRSHYYGGMLDPPHGGAMTEASAYRVAELYLNNGCNPNLKAMGALNYEIMRIKPRNDATMQAYFNTHGITPLNAAIRKNLFTVVDLLLDNGAVLDSDSLAYAREATVNCGGNPMMENKIRALLP